MRRLRERAVSLLIVASMALSVLPQGRSYAAGDEADGQDGAEAPAAAERITVETDWTSSVEYTDDEHSEAVITYTKHGVKADNANLLYLGDTSVNGKESFAAAKRMLADNGLSYIFDYGASPRACGITYQNTVLTDTGWLSYKTDVSSALRNTLNPGQGTPNEVRALQAAQAAIDALPAERLQYPTIVFWTLGEEFGNKDEAAIEAELKKLREKLDGIARDNGVDTGLMTFQYADQPSGLLKKYVITQRFPHESRTAPAAYASGSDFELRHMMAERLEQAVHEHYHKIEIDFDLEGAPLARKITGVEHSAVTAGAQAITDVSDDGRTAKVQIERLCRQIDVYIKIKVELDTSETGRATVFREQHIPMGDGANGMHTGIFDEKPVHGEAWHIYEAEASRELGKIRFTTEGDAQITGSLPPEASQMPGTRYVVPGQGDLLYTGRDFGGWRALDGELAGQVLREGSIIRFPSGEVSLRPIWGKAEVEKEITGTAAANLLPNRARRGLFGQLFAGTGISYRNIKTITVLNSLPTYAAEADTRKVEVPGAACAVDMGKKIAEGAAEDSIVIAYAMQRGSEYDIYIAGEGGITVEDPGFFDCPSAFDDPLQYVETVRLNGNLHLEGQGAVRLFHSHTDSRSLKAIDAETIDMSNVTDAEQMFNGCRSLRTLDIDNWDVSNVINMKSMFRGAFLETLDVSSWDVSNVTNMNGMFNNCYYLRELDISSWDTGNVTDMSQMFAMNYSAFYDDRLQSLNVSGLDTSNVTNMSGMFYSCDHLAALDVSSFDTSRVTDMSEMFSECRGVQVLDVSGFDTENVTSMSSMFKDCRGVQVLDVSGFNTGNVTSMSSMFNGCRGLQVLDVSGFNTGNVVEMGMNWMFAGCSSLQSLDVSRFETGNLTSMDLMFSSCSSLQNLDVSGFNTGNVTSMTYMFSGCSGLQGLDIGSWDVSQMTYMSNAFYDCSSLQELDLGRWEPAGAVSLPEAFYYCDSLRKLDVRNLGTNGVVNIDNAFQRVGANSGVGCELNVGSWDLQNERHNMARLFWGSNIPDIDLSGWRGLEGATSMQEMFAYSGAERIAFGGAWATESLDILTSMRDMFKGCDRLELIDLSGWSLPNLTDTSGMFNGCISLDALDLSFRGIAQANAGNFSVTDMFAGCPAGTLTITNTTDSQAPLNKIANEYMAATGGNVDGGIATSALDEAMEEELMLMEEAAMEEALLEGEGEDMAEEAPVEAAGEDAAEGIPVGDAGDADAVAEGGPTEGAGEDKIEDVDLDAAEGAGGAVIEDAPAVAPEEGAIADAPAEEPEGSEAFGAPMEKMAMLGQGFAGAVKELGAKAAHIGAGLLSRAAEGSGALREIARLKAAGERMFVRAAALYSPGKPMRGLAMKVGSVAPESGAGSGARRSVPEAEEGTEKDGTARKAVRAAGGYPNHWDNNPDLSVRQEKIELGPADKAEVEYTVIVKYTGDRGAISGQIELNDPISSDIVIDESSLTVHRAEPIPGTLAGYVGGWVAEEPHIVSEGGINYLRGKLDSLYAGSQIRISFKCTVSRTDGVTKKSGDYYYWDNTAYVTSISSSGTSKTARAWWSDDAIPDPDPGDEMFTLSYRYEGNVPIGVMVPPNEEHKQGDAVRLAVAPAAPRGYIFDGWYVDGALQTEITMPGAPVTAVGRWSIDEAAIAKIRFRYEYTGDVPEGAPEIGDVAAGAHIPAQQEVVAGRIYAVAQITADAGRHKFDGWIPSMEVAGQEAVGVENAQGIYSFEHDGRSYTVDVERGIVDTGSLAGLDDVEITFTGSWTPYKGTIRFDANGGDDSVPMAEMRDVEWNTARTLTPNSFTMEDYLFTGWSKSPNGEAIKADGDVADGLIERDGEEVTLYAIWKRSEYEVRYELSNVASSNMQDVVRYGDVYEATLSADESLGYYLDEASVEVTMNYSPITQTAYDPVTGRIRIENVSGDILIRASISDESGMPEGEIKGNRKIVLSKDASKNETTLRVDLSEPDPVRGTLTYQWQRKEGNSWKDMEGETGSSIHLPGLTMEDDGTQYRCKVTYTQGAKKPTEAIIGPAALTVTEPGEPEEPTEPEKPTEPEEPAGSTEDGAGSMPHIIIRTERRAPKTGDAAQPVMLLALMAASAGTIVLATRKRKA